MADSVLQQVVEIVQTDPHSGPALQLFALISTLRMEKSGYMYTLRKLRDFSPEHRQLAFELMELMAQNENQGEAWDAAVAAMDQAVKGG